MTINMVTRTGTNQLHGGGGMPGGTWGTMARARNFTDQQKKDLFASVPANVLAANPNIDPNADIKHSTDLSLWLAGPVVKDKLWYSVSWHDQRLLQYKLGSYNPDGTQVPDDNILWNTTEKVSYQLNKSAQISFFNNLQYKLIGHRGGATFGDEHARQYNFKYPDVNQLKYTSPFGTKVVMDVTYNHFRADDCFCKEPEVKAGHDFEDRYRDAGPDRCAGHLQRQPDVSRSGEGQRQLLHQAPRHPLRRRVAEGRREVAHLDDQCHAGPLQQRPAELGHRHGLAGDDVAARAVRTSPSSISGGRATWTPTCRTGTQWPVAWSSTWASATR